MTVLRVKRVRDTPTDDDGVRILVDRLWPRGVKKRDAKVSVWKKDVAPSTELRQWFNHKTERFEEFSQRYRQELETNPAVEEILVLLREYKVVTLVYGARAAKTNQAVVLARYLQEASAHR